MYLLIEMSIKTEGVTFDLFADWGSKKCHFLGPVKNHILLIWGRLRASPGTSPGISPRCAQKQWLVEHYPAYALE